MTQYNVVRNSRDEGGEQLPAILEAVFDGEVDASDPRVIAQLRADAAVARRFRETQRVADRLARRTAAPDLSASILAVVHAKQPFAASTRRRRVSPLRVAFAGGLLAGISLVIVLQNVSRTPRLVVPVVGPEAIALTADGPAASTAANDSIVGPRSQPASAARPSLAFANARKYEASTAPRGSAGGSGLFVAGNSGNIDVQLRTDAREVRVAQVLPDPCEPSTTAFSLAESFALTAQTPPSLGLTPTESVASYVPSREWPPADINAYVDHLSICGDASDPGSAAGAR